LSQVKEAVRPVGVCLHARDSISAAKAGIARYVAFYKTCCPHRSLDRQTPDAVYFNPLPFAAAA
jgi:putative transposase